MCCPGPSCRRVDTRFQYSNKMILGPLSRATCRVPLLLCPRKQGLYGGDAKMGRSSARSSIRSRKYATRILSRGGNPRPACSRPPPTGATQRHAKACLCVRGSTSRSRRKSKWAISPSSLQSPEASWISDEDRPRGSTLSDTYSVARPVIFTTQTPMSLPTLISNNFFLHHPNNNNFNLPRPGTSPPSGWDIIFSP